MVLTFKWFIVVCNSISEYETHIFSLVPFADLYAGKNPAKCTIFVHALEDFLASVPVSLKAFFICFYGQIVTQVSLARF
jgi:hypothetical protein